jgi:MoaA/NifB/PqqE/SkfB family radical SAM enzyme
MNIIQIKPIEKTFSITWMIGSRCNYDCMYCPTNLHDNTSVPHSLDTMQRAWKNIYSKSNQLNLNYKISITGGEVTANRNFLPFMQWIRNNYCEVKEIHVTTNGSASLEYYKKLAQVVESMCFSTHSEFFDEKKFFQKVIAIDKLMVRPIKSLHVNVMNEYWNQDRIALYKELLDKNNVSYSVNEIDYNLKNRDFIKTESKLNLDETRKS